MQDIYMWISTAVLELLQAQPGMVLFLILGIGYILGNLKLFGFSFGPVAGVLFVGLVFGNFGFRISSGAQMVGFALFIFSVGYQAGPGFIAVLKKDGFKYLALSLVVALSGFGLAVVWAINLDLPAGMSAGLLAGGLTSSPTLAAAQDAVYSSTQVYPNGLDAESVVDNIAMGYALTYIFGLVGLIITIRYLPKLVGIDLVKEAAAFQANGSSNALSADNVVMRTYKLTTNALSKMSDEELRNDFWDQKSVVRVVRNGQRLSVEDSGGLVLGDVIEVIGTREYFRKVINNIAEEIRPKVDTIVRQDSAQIIINNRTVIGNSFNDIEITRNFGLFLLEIRRNGKVLEHDYTQTIEAGDVLSVIGAPSQIEAIGTYLGHVERDGVESDMVSLSFGIVIGLFIGTLSVTLGGISIGLGSAGGLLVTGLFIGYRRSIRPTFGQLPEATRWFLMEFGLLLFMAAVGLRAGDGIIDALIEQGGIIILAGMSITIVPILLGYVVGHKVLKIAPALLFGAITGAMTSGAALSVVISEAKSPVPALGYTGTYAFANVLLVIAGSLIMMF